MKVTCDFDKYRVRGGCGVGVKALLNGMRKSTRRAPQRLSVEPAFRSSDWRGKQGHELSHLKLKEQQHVCTVSPQGREAAAQAGETHTGLRSRVPSRHKAWYAAHSGAALDRSRAVHPLEGKGNNHEHRCMKVGHMLLG